MSPTVQHVEGAPAPDVSAGRRSGPASTDKTTTELLRDLSEEMAALVRDEVRLARAELTQRGAVIGLGAGLLLGASVGGLLAAGALIAAAIAGISQVLSLWLSALVVGGGLLVLTLPVAMVGAFIVKRASPPVPARALASTKEDVEWLKTQTRSARP